MKSSIVLRNAQTFLCTQVRVQAPGLQEPGISLRKHLTPDLARAIEHILRNLHGDFPQSGYRLSIKSSGLVNAVRYAGLRVETLLNLLVEEMNLGSFKGKPHALIGNKLYLFANNHVSSAFPSQLGVKQLWSRSRWHSHFNQRSSNVRSPGIRSRYIA